jgi:hypothetical protein
MSDSSIGINAQDESTHIATLVWPEEYVKSPNQVAIVNRKTITFVKRKEFAMTPYAVEQFPTESCSAITYRKRFALAPMIFGIICILCSGIALFISPLHKEVPHMRIGLLLVMVVTGFTLVFGVKRHRLIFMVDGKKLKWQSKAGEYKDKKASIRKVLDYAREKGLLSTESDPFESV